MKLLTLLALLMVSFTASQVAFAENCEAINDGSRSTSSEVVEAPASDEESTSTVR